MWEHFYSGYEAHVWQMSATSSVLPIAELFQILSAEEKGRASKFKFIRDQSRYIRSHGILRLILAAYMRQNPAELVYEYNQFGKPYLVNQPNGNEIHFNMTHDEDVALYIISSKNQVGIDLEKVKCDYDWHGVAKQYFSLQEMRFIQSVPADKQTHAFFYTWTRKEALLKALGIGLSGVDTMKESVLSPLSRKYVLFSYQLEENYHCSLAISPMQSKVRFFHPPAHHYRRSIYGEWPEYSKPNHTFC